MRGLRGLGQLLDPKVKSVLDSFLQKDELFHLKKISEESNVPLATTFRIILRLVKSGFLDVTTVGKLKLYKIKEKIPSYDVLVDSKIYTILNIFYKNQNQLFHLKKLSLSSKVPLATTFRLVSELKKAGFIETIVVGKMKLYKANEKTRRLAL